MSRCRTRPVFAVALVWACAACGRLGFDVLAVDAEAAIDATQVVELDAGVVQDAGDSVVDATAAADVGVTIADSGTLATTDMTAMPATVDSMPVDAAVVADAGPTMCPMIPPKVGTNLKIDDVEDGDSFIIAADARRGSW